MPETLFHPAPFFLVRSPIWPIEIMEKICSQEKWEEAILQLYYENGLFREAVAIASPPLYQSLQKSPLKEPLKTSRSLLRYLMRMSTRATPFGLFSYVAFGEWSEKTEVSFDPVKLYKKVRPDMEWVYAFIQKIYSDQERLPFLSIYANPLAYLRADRLSLNYICEENKKSDKNLSIFANEIVQLILNEAKNPLPIAKLLKKILTIKPALDELKTLKMIQELLSNQFLLPSILPSLLSHPLEQLSSLHVFGIDSLLQAIHECNFLPLGKGEEKLVALQQQMEKIAPAKTYLQVDTALTDTALHLPKNIGDELAKTTEFLWRLSCFKMQFSELSSYHSKFLEKYGIYRTVPLLQMLDSEKGLGNYINDENKPSLLSPSPTEQKWDQWLLDKWQGCLRDRKEELVLDETFLQFFEEEHPVDYSKAPLSFDCFFKIIAKSTQEIDEGKFKLFSFQTSWQGGSTFGRFIDLLGPRMEDTLKTFYQNEEELDENSYFVELSYLPKFVRSANVALRPCLRKYRLDLGAKQEKDSFSLQDIYVGATHDRFYLTLEKGGCEIHCCTGNMLSLTAAPLPLRFMQDVSIAKYKPVYPFSWGPLSEVAAFLPRVSFRKTIIFPKKWNLNGKDFTQKSKEKIKSDFLLWADKWALPERVLLAEGDQHLLLERSHLAHLEELIRRLKKGESLQFFEFIDQTWMKSGSGNYAPEMVVPFLKNQTFVKNQAPFIASPYLKIPIETRLKLPGSEWLFIKFYLEEEGRDRFLLKFIAPLAKHLEEEGIIHGWFYVRYNDPEPHLRIRFRLSSTESIFSILPLIQQSSLEWIKKGFIKNMVIIPYEREIERYGGEALIEGAESLFCRDTLAIIHLLQFSKKQFPYHESILHALSVVQFMLDLGLNLNEIILFFCDQKDEKELKDFRKHKKELISLLQSLPEIELFRTMSSLRKSISSFLVSQLQLQNPMALKSIYSSLLHMHCNRLGCNESQEKRAILYSRHALMHILKMESLSQNTVETECSSSFGNIS
jgi:lantibiotic biosynthesis protein